MTVQPIAFFYHWPCPLSFQNVESKKKNDGSLLPPPHGHADLTHSTSCWLLQTKWFWNRLYFFSRQLAVVPVYYTNILIVQTRVLPKKNEKMSLHWFLGPSETTWQNPFKGKISCCFFFFFIVYCYYIVGADNMSGCSETNWSQRTPTTRQSCWCDCYCHVTQEMTRS